MSLLRFLFSFRGRTPRVGFWLFYLAHAFVYGVISIVLYVLARPYFGEHYQKEMEFAPLIPLFVLFTAIFFIPAAAVTTRRLHDRGHSGWWVFLGVGLAVLAYAVVATYSYEFRIYQAGYDELPRRELMQLVMAVAVFAMIGYAPFALVVLVLSFGFQNLGGNPGVASHGHNYILPALLGVTPLAVFGLWFIVEAGVRRGDTSANAYGAPPSGSFSASGTVPPSSLSGGVWQMAGAAGAIAGAAVLFSGILEVREKACDLGTAAGTPLPANEFQDCFDMRGNRICGPLMVKLPKGSYQMGSTRLPQETPVHTVTFAKPFALGKFELTYAQWEACVADGACRKYKAGHWNNLSRDPTGERCKKPVAVNWSDATSQYFPWLSSMTGKAYRLPSESEWEYAARAGTDTGFPPGNIVKAEYANYDDSSEAERQVNPEPNKIFTFEDMKWKDTCWDYSTHKGQRLDVGTLKPNAFGLHDMLGNRAELVADVFNARYDGVPTDGSAAACTTSNYCDERVLRGGDSCTRSNFLTPTARDLVKRPEGFRAALTLD